MKKIIYGCESRGDKESPYLIRYTLLDLKAFQICLHVFLRSDHDEHHDHPWNFISIILWRGYFEETIDWPRCTRHNRRMYLHEAKYECYDCNETVEINKEARLTKRIWPGIILYRKAKHRHRVVLKEGKKAVTLVIMGRRVREWGFFTNSGWLKWTNYFIKNKC